MRSLYLVILATCVVFSSSCNNDSYSGSSSSVSSRPKTSSELKAELKEQELNSPQEYLECKNVKLTFQQKKVRNAGLFRPAEYAPDGAIVEGDIVNSATLAKYKDLELKVAHISQTNTVISEKTYVIYEYFAPHSTKHFSFKIPEVPSAGKQFSTQIVGAKPSR